MLPNDADYGIATQFNNQARTALRVAHFISAFMQNVDPQEEYGSFYGDRLLNHQQLYDEVLSNMLGHPGS